ncbi:hypothetical protein jhhlp_008250 [Lomentospora prolificans]|uniref:Zn(2)-C6 fungal-type domain-containing protein n=1 Tax=Lomentospora prolificans TaxID=41688 RepID=A0A2N3MXI9_9PEZI|nr:hypothetical protein jhhlp_008250 [Lomentospora prolificans]
MPRPKATRQRLARRACDSCKVRKIRCTEAAPCNGCVTAGIECTFTRVQAQRGPRGLRAGTIEKINLNRQRQQQPQSHSLSPDAFSTDSSKPHATAADPAAGASSSLSSSYPSAASDIPHFLSFLEIYASRLFPVWPIIDAAKLKQDLIVNPEHAGSLRLANAVALATIAQLKLETEWQPDPDTLQRLDASETTDLLDNLRTSFFLHIYHENLAAGGAKSLLFLREAITQAQILRLEHESSYVSLPDAEQQICRRVLWLLFVTERGVALLHKLPPILKPNILFPGNGAADSCSQILPAFLKLVHLFWIFDHSGIFEILQDTESNATQAGSLVQSCLEILQQKLQESITDDDWGSGNDVQRADVFLTRQWMRAILSRAAFKLGIQSPTVNPVSIAREFLSLVSRIPPAALESHGATLEFKTFEIATTVIDAMTKNYPGISVDGTADTLFSLRDMLSSSRGGNNKLLSLLNTRLRDIFGSPDAAVFQPYALQFRREGALIGTAIEAGDANLWSAEDILAQMPLTTTPPPPLLPVSASREDESQIPWLTLDLTSFARSPSPFTRILLDIDTRETLDELFGMNAEAECGVLIR